jgi:hypothetical protein
VLLVLLLLVLLLVLDWLVRAEANLRGTSWRCVQAGRRAAHLLRPFQLS